MNNDPIHSEDTQRHDPWLQRARTLYQEAGERVDAASLRSLDATRRALRNTTAPARRRLLPVLVPAGAMLAAALTLAVVWRPPHAPTASAPVPTAAALVAGADGHELEMAQNLDFYAWLANQPAPANGGSVQ